MFWFLLMVAGNDSTRAIFSSGMKSLLEDPEQLRAGALGRGPARAGRRGVRALPPGLRLHAPHRDPRHRDRRPAGRRGRQGRCSGTSRATATRRVFEDPHRFDVRRDPNPHQGFGGGGRHFCLGAGLARLEMKLWLEETLRRFPRSDLDGDCERVSSTFLNQYRTIPVALQTA